MLLRDAFKKRCLLKSFLSIYTSGRFSMDLLRKQTNASDRISISFFPPSSRDRPVGISAELTALLCLFVHFGFFLGQCFIIHLAQSAENHSIHRLTKRSILLLLLLILLLRAAALSIFARQRHEWTLPLSDDEWCCRNIAEMCNALPRRSCAFLSPPYSAVSR